MMPSLLIDDTFVALTDTSIEGASTKDSSIAD
jgi:hypothetical protein